MKECEKFRTAIFYKDYFEVFFLKQSAKIKTKIIRTIQLVEELKIVPSIYLKHIEATEGLYEIRVNIRSNAIRIFCFF